VTFGDGTHVIGSSLPAGTYRTRANVSGCYWERLSGFSGQSSDIIANDFGATTPMVTISASDIGFTSNDCGGVDEAVRLRAGALNLLSTRSRTVTDRARTGSRLGRGRF